MPIWETLDFSTENAVWERFETQFLFRLGDRTHDWPGILEPAPSVTYSISTLLQSEGDTFQQRASEIHSKMLGAFRNCFSPGQRLYALDWQHQCYWFSPHDQIQVDAPTSWPISIFPYGDYHIFLSEDLSEGTFGHPWKETICVFGECLLSSVQKDLPGSFQELRRKP